MSSAFVLSLRGLIEDGEEISLSRRLKIRGLLALPSPMRSALKEKFMTELSPEIIESLVEKFLDKLIDSHNREGE